MGSTWWTSPWGPAGIAVARSPLLSWEAVDRPVITTPPSSVGISGVLLVVQPIITIQTQLGLTDLLYTGPVNVGIMGAGTLTGQVLGVAVLGVVVFVGVTITGSGVSQLVFSLPDGSAVVSGNITIL